MSPMPRITLLVASLHVLFYLLLSVRVALHRQAHRIGVGTGGDEAMTRKVRVHANFAEYVPFTLLTMALAESMAPPDVLVHASGLLLLAGRLLHAYGVSRSPPIMRYRVYGMWLTFAALGLAALVCLALSAFFLAV